MTVAPASTNLLQLREVDAGYGPSPNGGYASSSSMTYATARTRHRM